MLTKIIVGAYATLIEISLWLILLVALVGGWQAGGFMGAIGALIGAFIFGAMFMGAFLVLEDIRKSVKAIESRK